jgi:hypothetical protein
MTHGSVSRGAVLAVAVLAVLAAPSPADNQGAPQQRYQASVAALHRRMEPLTRAYQATNWPADSPQAIGKLLHGDPQACAAFVRERLRYEPYSGILRGANGALTAGGGNSADLALLLSEMVGSADSPPQFRFVVAQLSNEQADALLKGAISQPPAETVVAGGSPGEELPAMPHVQPDPPAQDSFRARAAADLDQLAPMLEGLNRSNASWRGAMEAARTHIWLQVRQKDEWATFDPSGNLPLPPSGTQVLDRLPQEWNHRVGLLVEVEALSGGKLSRAPLMEGQWTAAALYGRPLELEIIPRQLSLAAMFDGKESAGFLQQAQSFEDFDLALSLPGEEPRVGKSFNLRGSSVAADKGEIGGQVDPFGAFHRPGQAAEQPTQLSGVWVTLTVGLNDNSPRKIERALLDRIGPAARAGDGTLTIDDAWKDERRVRIALFQRHQILIGGGPFDTAKLARDVLDSIAQGGILDQALAVKFGQGHGPFSKTVADLALPSAPAELIALQNVPAALAQAGVAGRGICFAGTPQVFIHSRTFDVREDKNLIARDEIDIAGNDLVFLLPPGAADDAVLLHGLWASELEGELLERGGSSPVHAAGIIRAAARQRIALRRMEAAADLALTTADINTKAVMARKLAEGNILIAPATPVVLNGIPRFAWWQIASTGQILAIGSDGHGQASEGVMVLKKISIPMVKRCMKFVYCFNKAVAGGGGMNESAAECLSDSIKEIVKESLDTAIDTFIVDPMKEKVSDARKEMLGKEYNALYENAKKAYADYQKVQSAIADPAGMVPGVNEGRGAAKGGRAVGETMGWRLYLLLNDGREIAHYASQL